MTFPSSLVHWPCFWLTCPQCLSHPLLKGALNFSFLGSELQDWANSSPSGACQGCQAGGKHRGEENTSLPAQSSPGHVLWKNPRTPGQDKHLDQNQGNTFTLRVKTTAKPGFVHQGSFSPAATVWLPGDTALRSWDPKSTPTEAELSSPFPKVWNPIRTLS